MVQFAIKTPPQHCTWQQMLDIWTAADDLEVFSAAWNFDHFYPIAGDMNGGCMEGWTTLTALAQATKRLRVGCMVHGMHYRHPAVTANMAATLDIISGGRLTLGLGAGWFEPESEAYGLELGTLTERFDRFDEGVDVITSLLSNETTTYDGKYYQLKDARCEPKGPQSPNVPIMIGGQGEKRTLRTVARHANMWDSLRMDIDDWKAKREVLYSHCADIGRDPSEIETSTHFMFAPDSNVNELANDAMARGEAGVDHVIFSMRAPLEVKNVEALAAALAAVV